MLGVVRRCSWPEDPDRAARDGFVVALTEAGNPIYRNPAAVHIVPLLPHILAVLRVQNELFAPDVQRRLHQAFRGCCAMLENEKRTLMGVPAALMPVDPMDPERGGRRASTGADTAADNVGGGGTKVQTQLAMLFDNCYHLMGCAGPSLGRDLYQLPGIAEALCGSVFAGLEAVPDYRIRPIVRVFLKPFVYSCPPAFYESVLLPVWAHLGPRMLSRLTAKWAYIAGLYESGELGSGSGAAGGQNTNDASDDAGSADTAEVLEDMLNRTLTREYLDVIKVALVGGALSDAQPPPSAGMVAAGSTQDVCSGVGGGMMEAMDEQASMDSPPHNVTRASQSAMAAEVISELGARLLRCQQTCQPLVLTVLR